MVKELVFTPLNQKAPSSSGEQDVAGSLQIPVSVRKFQIRLIENVSQADFIQAARTEELCEAIEEIPHHAVANSLVEGHGYPQRILQIEAPFRDTFKALAGEYYIGDEQILSYKKVDAGQVAGLLDLPPEARNMQLVMRSDTLVDRKGDEEEVIDMIAIRVEGQHNMGSLIHFIKDDPNLKR